MSDDDFKNLEHTVHDLDEHLTATVKDVKKLQEENATLRIIVRDCVDALNRFQEHAQPIPLAPNHQGWAKLKVDLFKLTEKATALGEPSSHQ